MPAFVWCCCLVFDIMCGFVCEIKVCLMVFTRVNECYYQLIYLPTYTTYANTYINTYVHAYIQHSCKVPSRIKCSKPCMCMSESDRTVRTHMQITVVVPRTVHHVCCEQVHEIGHFVFLHEQQSACKTTRDA